MAMMVPELPVSGLTQASAVEELELTFACATADLIISASVLAIPAFFTGFETDVLTSDASLFKPASFESLNEHAVALTHKPATAITRKNLDMFFPVFLVRINDCLPNLGWLPDFIPL